MKRVSISRVKEKRDLAVNEAGPHFPDEGKKEFSGK